jgi:putative ABC transport system permease protein
MWRVARAAVRRRKLQTVVIGVVVGVATATLVMALGLLASSSAPFDRAFAQQNGAHLVAAFSTSAPAGATADRSGVEAAEGPFDQVVLGITGVGMAPPRAMTTVGRADPGGRVDRLNVWTGRWVTGPGEIVLNEAPGASSPNSVGDRLTPAGGPALTIVGFAYSVSASADAWVTPDQMTELTPTATQMLYRFTSAATAGEISAAQKTVTAGLAKGEFLGAQSYLAVKQNVAEGPGVYVPFLVMFGVLGLAVAVLIVANVVSGAVVAGTRHIGMLKALGFTQNQVMAVYVVMVSVPAAVGCVLGTILGNAVTRPMLADAFAVFGATDLGVPAWVDVAALLGMPAVVALAALLPALRARGLSAAQAISAGSAQKVGRALAVQRWLSGARLPRSVSLGLGVPFARPARSVLTLASVVLGVMSVTLAVGVTMSVNAYRDAVHPTYQDRVQFSAGGKMPILPGEQQPDPTLSDAGDEALLRSLPGTVHVAATARRPVQVVGGKQDLMVSFYRGDAELAPTMSRGDWPRGAGEVAVPSRFLNQRGMAVGDSFTVERDGERTSVRIVGVVLTNSPSEIFADWATLTRLEPDARAENYLVDLVSGTDQTAYVDAVLAGDPGLLAVPAREDSSSMALVIISLATLLTVVLGAVAALGVFNTVVLNTRERRRDLGMLKSIGMTPRQVTVMMVTSMGALGVLGGLLGLPLGVAAHRLLAPAMMSAAQSDAIDVVIDVYRTPILAALAAAGVAIAVIGAFIPARTAARTTIAEVLHNE